MSNNKPRFIAKVFTEPNRSEQTVSADKKSVFYNYTQLYNAKKSFLQFYNKKNCLLYNKNM